MPVTLKDFALVQCLAQNGHRTVMNCYMFLLITPGMIWQLSIQCFAYCYGAGVENTMEYRFSITEGQIWREIQVIKKPCQNSGL